jgi:tetratricopeptide (TPR) repeat protein
MKYFYSTVPLVLLCLCVSCVSSVVRTEEYYALGTAYFELQKYTEAERWFKKAHGNEKTRASSEYYLGRIAFETGRYEAAARYFDRILSRDPQNVTALKAGAFSRIKSGDLDGALVLYDRVLELVPESADEGYNYALVLLATGNPEKAEEVLLKQGMPESADAQLLLARSQKAQGKPEAVDSYKNILTGKDTVEIRFEYAEALEAGQYYAGALEEYRLALEKIDDANNTESSPPEKSLVLFRIARVMLVADPKNAEGADAFSRALDEGFNDTGEIEALISGLPAANRNSLIKIRNERLIPKSEADGQ